MCMDGEGGISADCRISVVVCCCLGLTGRSRRLAGAAPPQPQCCCFLLAARSLPAVSVAPKRPARQGPPPASHHAPARYPQADGRCTMGAAAGGLCARTTSGWGRRRRLERWTKNNCSNDRWPRQAHQSKPNAAARHAARLHKAHHNKGRQRGTLGLYGVVQARLSKWAAIMPAKKNCRRLPPTVGDVAGLCGWGCPLRLPAPCRRLCSGPCDLQEDARESRAMANECCKIRLC